MAERAATDRLFRTWLFPFSILGGIVVTLFALTFVLDVARQPDQTGIWSLLWHPNPASALDTLTNASQVACGLLAIAVTVVAIVVELASNRYTHRITELFTTEPINFAVMGFFVVTTAQCLFVSYVVDHEGTGFMPYIGVGVTMVLLATSLVILLPYFAWVFYFLSPLQILSRIRSHALDEIKKCTPARVIHAHREAVRGIEQLSDVSINAMENKDKGVSMGGVDALRGLVEDYQSLRANLPDDWFRIEGELAHNPDFVSMAPEVIDEVVARKSWFELKVLRQYQTIYNEALNRMRDINYLIAINTRLIGNTALRHRNFELLQLVIKFFNTYLRATINAKDVRTAYNVLNQYRLLAESLLSIDNGSLTIQIARYFKYYGRLSFDVKLSFILETVAYDLCTLNELAFDQKSPAARELLRIFLEVDKESEGEHQEAGLRGVRKAQIKLATYYLVSKDEALAREVHADMAHERAERLASIRDELLGVESRDFWEISDRGMNFDFLDADRKKKMMEFFSWFAVMLPPPRPSIAKGMSLDMMPISAASKPTTSQS